MRAAGTVGVAGPSNRSRAKIGDEMKQRARSVLLAAPAVLAIALIAAVSACGSTAAPQSVHSAADTSGRSGAASSGVAGAAGSAASSADKQGASGRTTGTSIAAVPPAAKRVPCPGVMPPLRLPGLVQSGGAVQPNGPIQPEEPIPPGFRPAAVVECVTVAAVHHGVVRIEERRQAAIAGLGRLMTALRHPYHPQLKVEAPTCMRPAVPWPWFVLVGANGRVIHPIMPVGICGQPAPGVRDALNSLHWIPLGTVWLRPIPFRPPMHGGPIHDITPGIPVSP
jgi:hypothetical protein